MGCPIGLSVFDGVMSFQFRSRLVMWHVTELGHEHFHMYSDDLKFYSIFTSVYRFLPHLPYFDSQYCSLSGHNIMF